MGTFGEHVQAFELLRSDQRRLVCSKAQNPEMFHATIGGMGLTGLMLWVEFQLKRINNPLIAVEEIKYRNLDEFFRLAEESEGSFEYTVAWVDCLARGSGLGKGIFMRGNDATRQQGADAPAVKEKKQVVFPFNAPNFLLNRLTVSAFNSVYYHKQFRRQNSKLTHYDPFFYPLDSIHQWNRLYGKRGFLQYQFVVPPAQSREVIANVLGKIARSGTASFLSVMKTFGERPPAGLMSFPRKGLTLALDLPNLGEPVMRLLETLDEIVLQNGGVVYPAKDARMSARHFQLFYPQWKEFTRFMDPRFSSSFWRRVTTG
jgi:FAD/FMN-containing dehydrogenase